MVCSRRELMMDVDNPTVFSKKYAKVKNIIVDEAQNFKDRDGDWYTTLDKLSKQHIIDQSSDCSQGSNAIHQPVGYFWIFMDYAQKVHKFKAGLPGLIGKNNFMLSEISRNSKEIFEYASKFMGKSNSRGVHNEKEVRGVCGKKKSAEGDNTSPEDGEGKYLVKDVATLGHEFSSGNQVNVLKCEKSAIHDMLFKILKKFSDEGIDMNDLAILVGKKSDSKAVQDIMDQRNSLKEEKTEQAEDNNCRIVSKSSAPMLTHESNINISKPGPSSLSHSPSSLLSPPPPPPSSVTDELKSEIEMESKSNLQSNSGTAKTALANACDIFDPMDTSPSNLTSTSNSNTVSEPTDHDTDQGQPFDSLVISGGGGSGGKSTSNNVLVSTVREFSGLDKPYIIGLDPHTNPEHADIDKLILNMATRARDSLVILTTSDELIDKLKPPQ